MSAKLNVRTRSADRRRHGTFAADRFANALDQFTGPAPVASVCNPSNSIGNRLRNACKRRDHIQAREDPMRDPAYSRRLSAGASIRREVHDATPRLQDAICRNASVASQTAKAS